MSFSVEHLDVGWMVGNSKAVHSPMVYLSHSAVFRECAGRCKFLYVGFDVFAMHLLTL